jgi:hypothetical protein
MKTKSIQITFELSLLNCPGRMPKKKYLLNLKYVWQIWEIAVTGLIKTSNWRNIKTKNHKNKIIFQKYDAPRSHHYLRGDDSVVYKSNYAIRK